MLKPQYPKLAKAIGNSEFWLPESRWKDPQGGRGRSGDLQQAGFGMLGCKGSMGI